jgi:hypothetical protein
MTTLQWFLLPRLPDPVANMKLWGAVAGGFRYVVGFDPDYQCWSASVAHETNPYKHFTTLGARFATQAEAVAACEQYRLQKERNENGKRHH